MLLDELPADAAKRNRPRMPVSSEAFGQMRQMWTDLDHNAGVIREAVQNIPEAMARAAATGRVGSNAALERIARRLPLPLLSRASRRAIWRFVQPDSGQPPAIQVWAVLLGATGRRVLTVEPFGLLATRHALGRCFDQTGGRADLCGEILAAHNALLTLPTDEGEQLFTTTTATFILPSLTGAFLVEPRSRVGDQAPSAVCKTWLHVDQLSQHQIRDAATWAELISASAILKDSSAK